MTYFIRRWTWFSLAAPFVALALCYLEASCLTDFLWPEDMFPVTRICLVWRWSFVASAIVCVLALAGCFAVREKWCIIRAVAGMVFTFGLGKFAELLTMIC